MQKDHHASSWVMQHIDYHQWWGSTHQILPCITLGYALHWTTYYIGCCITVVTNFYWVMPHIRHALHWPCAILANASHWDVSITLGHATHWLPVVVGEKVTTHYIGRHDIIALMTSSVSLLFSLQTMFAQFLDVTTV